MPSGYDHYDSGMKKSPGGLSPLLRVDRDSSRPLHAQIYAGFRAAILERSLRAGERIPSTRTLARELGISRIPALNAYSQLLAEGYFESRDRCGHVCVEFPAGVMDERADMRNPAGSRGAARCEERHGDQEGAQSDRTTAFRAHRRKPTRGDCLRRAPARCRGTKSRCGSAARARSASANRVSMRFRCTSGRRSWRVTGATCR